MDFRGINQPQHQNDIPPFSSENTSIFSAHQIKNNRQNKDGKKKKKNSYHWSGTEMSRYVRFLAQKQDLFSLPAKDRRQANLYIKMSKAIKTRNNVQCHTHHQKMVMRFKTIGEIIGEHEEARVYIQGQRVEAQVGVGEGEKLQGECLLLRRIDLNDWRAYFSDYSGCLQLGLLKFMND